MAGSTSSFIVQELRRAGAGVLEDTPVRFEWTSQSHSMPQDIVEFALHVVSVRETPPGAEEPVEQVLGIEWTPFELHGEWKDSWAGQGFAWDTFVQFARLVGRAPLVRLQLQQLSFVAILTDLKIRYRTDFEIGYAVTVSPHVNEAIGQFRRAAPVTPPAIPFDSRVADHEEMYAGILDSFGQASSVPTGTEDLSDALDSAKDLRGELDRSSAAASDVAIGADDTTSILDLADRTQHKLLGLAAAFGRVAGAALETALSVQELAAGDIVAYDDVVAMLSFEEWTRTTQTESVRLYGSARAAQIDARSRAAQRIRTIYRARSGDSLERIATKYLGSPDSWRLIYDANNMDSILVVPGRDYIIPEKQQ